MTYYHATTKDRVESIQQHGLGGLPNLPKNFIDSEDGVYLAVEPMLALGFLLERALAGEWGKTSPKEVYQKFVVIVIDDSRINAKFLFLDSSFESDDVWRQQFWCYQGVIDVTAMPVISAEDVLISEFGSLAQ